MSPENFEMIMIALITGGICSIGSSLLTVAGLRVHIDYLRKADAKHEENITYAHKRIDEINQNGCERQGGKH